MSRSFSATILHNDYQTSLFKRLVVKPSSTVILPEPGQFYMLQTGDSFDPLLKRPFSIFSYEENTLHFLYRIRGKGTHSLSKLKEGTDIQLIGPLGNSYPAPEGNFIAVAGGIGIASLFPLLQKFEKRAHLCYGARNKAELVMVDEARKAAKELFIATDDGSAGGKGFVTEYLKHCLDSSPGAPVYACGPTPMLHIVAKKVRDRGIPCYVSLEEHMACGIGACLGCVVKTTAGQKRVCKEGPVFAAEEIIW
ncbi:MAG: dihydroorotate dehydrogenase electron transfer subunit [Nitrospirota bacterium]